VVEFDDVINRQRETIYAERDKVLRNEALTETVREFLDDEVEALADTYLGGSSLGEWNLEGLSAALRAMGLDGDDTSESALEEAGRSREDIAAYVRDVAEARLEGRMAEHGEEVWGQVERFVLLRTIDSLWVEHLTELDDMRRGIGLRGYAQQDPLNEFRKEAFRLYEELRDLIRRQVATTIFRVTVKREPATVPLPGPGQPSRPGQPGQRHVHADGSVHDGPAHDEAPGPGAGALAAASAPRAALSGGQAALRRPTSGLPDPSAIKGLAADPMRTARQAPGDAKATDGSTRPGYTPSGARIGRNDPCWCGSGQKYKKCHGA
jgi:preprotein translocase subunit SecA